MNDVRNITQMSRIPSNLCKEEPREPMSYTTGFLVKVSDQHESVADADDGVLSVDYVMHFP